LSLSERGRHDRYSILVYAQFAIVFALDQKNLLVSLRTGSATDIVESEVSDAGVHLEEKRERLANATGSTKNGDLGEL
jgi:hypothetical protein